MCIIFFRSMCHGSCLHLVAGHSLCEVWLTAVCVSERCSDKNWFLSSNILSSVSSPSRISWTENGPGYLLVWAHACWVFQKIHKVTYDIVFEINAIYYRVVVFYFFLLRLLSKLQVSFSQHIIYLFMFPILSIKYIVNSADWESLFFWKRTVHLF